MKTPVTVTMLIVGGSLLLAPFFFNALHEHEMAQILTSRPDLTNLTFGNSELLSPVACWMTGMGLCLAAVIGGVRDARLSYKRDGLARTAAAPLA